MTLFYDQSVPFLIKGLEALTKFMKKAEGQCDERKIDKSVVLGLRLAPDMLNFTRQILIVTDQAKGAGARCSGITPPVYADDEKTFDELQARLAKTIEFLKTLKAADFDPNRDVTIKIAGQDVTMKALAYFNGGVLPNFYFHMSTAYDILRANGFSLGKADFLGRG